LITGVFDIAQHPWLTNPCRIASRRLMPRRSSWRMRLLRVFHCCSGSLRDRSCRPAASEPIEAAQASSDPVIELPDRGVGVADAEVVHPAGDVATQFVDDVLHPVPPVAGGDLPDALFEPL